MTLRFAYIPSEIGYRTFPAVLRYTRFVVNYEEFVNVGFVSRFLRMRGPGHVPGRSLACLELPTGCPDNRFRLSDRIQHLESVTLCDPV